MPNMKNNYISQLFMLIVLMPLAVSANQTDHDYLKAQQKSLDNIRETLRGQTVTLPPIQAQRVQEEQQKLLAWQQQNQDDQRQESTPQALYFVSFSIPKEGLKQMMDEAVRYKMPVLIRGLVNNDFRQTVEKTFNLVKEENKGGVQIDPENFKRYNVTAVPALVVTCGNSFDVLYGNLRIQEALEDVVRRGECGPVAKQILEAAQ